MSPNAIIFWLAIIILSPLLILIFLTMVSL
jgi:hypothetical protein